MSLTLKLARVGAGGNAVGVARAAFIAAFVAFIIGPIVVLALWSVAQQWFWPSLWPSAFTTRWYEWAVTVPNVFRALRNSLIVAVIVTVATTIVALPAGIALGRNAFFGRAVVRGLFSLPLLVPYISLGRGLTQAIELPSRPGRWRRDS